MRQNLPLAMSLESAAGIRNDAQAKTLRAISGWLAQGYTLSESVKRGYPKCPRYAATMITAAERINQLPQAFKSIEADIAAKSEENKKIEPVSLFYPLVLVLVIGFFVWGILTFIMPQLHMILIEMGGEESMPACTNFLMDIFGFFVDESGVLFFTILGLVVFVALPYCIYMRFHRREPQKPRISSQVGDWFKWRLPVVRSLERNNSMLRVAEMIRLSLNAGCTVNDAIANTLDLDINNCLRKRIRKWLARVEKGEDISKAANASGTGRGLAWAFDKNANRDDAPTALEILESFYRLNYNYRANLARFIAEPTVTLIMASLVGFVVYAIYSAPVAIIYHATEAVYP
ncbi:MAG: type II secretion system F family protein [Sedimentisphaerales bacterium]|nr:type II secretion system F family protein [Sedimentisphaerales bacterium]